MAKRTLQQKYCNALRLLGEVEFKDARTNKYIVFYRTMRADGSKFAAKYEKNFWYAGPGGSLRVGPTVADSIPCGEVTKLKLLQLDCEEQKQLALSK